MSGSKPMMTPTDAKYSEMEAQEKTRAVRPGSHKFQTLMTEARNKIAVRTQDRKTFPAGQDSGPSLIMRDIINFGTAFACLGVAGYIFLVENSDPYRHMVGGAVFGTILLIGAFRTWTCPCPYDTNDDQILIAGAGIMLGYFLVHWLRCCKAQTYSLIFVAIGLFQILRTICKTFGIIPCNW